MRHQLPLTFLLASTAACLSNTPAGTEETTTDVTSALEQPTGGFETTDELPMFDQEPAFAAAAIEQSAEIADPMASDPEVTAIANAPSAARHRLLIAWGRMPPDLNATTGVDWSGSLTISRGALVVGRTIGFEQLTDRVLPRQTPERIDFQSMTRPFADGLALRVLDPDPGSGALVLTYHSATFGDRALDLSQLAAGPISVDMGDGNRIVIAGIPERDACDHGFMRGRWVALSEHLGVYRGLVTNEAGDVTGHIRGIWGQRATGEKVMFGKFIALDGSFRGVVAGTYGEGQFRGRWLTAAGDHGGLGGRYFDSPEVRGGGFMGRWAEASCAQ